MFPATMKQLVITNCTNINVRIMAIVSASLLDLPDLSPNAFAQTLHKFFTLIFYIPCQKLSTGCIFLDKINKLTLVINHSKFTTHACLQQYLLFTCTIKRFVSLSVYLTNCSRINEMTNPTAKI